MTPFDACAKIVSLFCETPDLAHLWGSLGAVTRRIAEGKLVNLGWEVQRKQVTPTAAVNISLSQLSAWDDWCREWNRLDLAVQSMIRQRAVAIFAQLVEAKP